MEVREDTTAGNGDILGSFDVMLSGVEVYTAFAAGYLTPNDEPADEPFALIVEQDSED